MIAVPEGDQNRRLYQKYTVEKLQGPTDPNADYFVLRLDKDPAARKAALAYADAVAGEYPLLARDLWKKVAEHEKDAAQRGGQVT